MWALIAFIALGIVVAALIEINERIKAKQPKEDCTREEKETAACQDCSLLDVCEKSSGSTAK